MKVLSPARNFESLKVAVYNGADEVYLGINNFNARNNIDGFNLDNLQNAVDFAHIYGVRVCLAINILFSNEELQSALDTVIKAYNLGVDAFIMQDLGLIKLVNENFPQIELHASTQMGLHNLEGVKFVEKLGVKRVVLARETPLEEIKRIKENSNVEIEYFVQGALCVSFSGNCYLSSYMLNASGNRGKCKQLCRLPYTLKKDGKQIKKGYLLSAKDFNMSKRLSDLKDAGVDVLKIEGRARRAYYVATATREYRRAVDGLKPNQDKIKLAFNREYTAGYFDGNGSIISELQNHIGIEVGEVIKVNYGKNFNQVIISSNRELSQKSTFKIFENGVEKCVLTAYDIKLIDKNKYLITTTKNLSKGDKINLIIDAFSEQTALSYVKKKKIELYLTATPYKPIVAEIKVDGKFFKVEGEVLQEAQKQPLTQIELEQNFSKSDYFEVDIVKCNIENVFIAKGKLNEFRRKVFDCTFEHLTTPFFRDLNSVKIDFDLSASEFKNFQFVEDLNEQLKEENIVYSPEIYQIDKISWLKEKCEKLGKKFFLDTPNFALKKDVEFLAEIIEKTGVNIVANNYYALTFDTKKVIGGGLNVYNSLSARYLSAPIICAESSLFEGVKFPYMTLRHCPIKSHANGTCKNCKYSSGYEYIMDSGKTLKLKRKKLTTCTFYLT